MPHCELKQLHQSDQMLTNSTVEVKNLEVEMNEIRPLRPQLVLTLAVLRAMITAFPMECSEP